MTKANDLPHTDPTPIFEHFRGSYATELLVAGVAHLRVFDHLADGPQTFEELRAKLGLAARPAVVLVTALRAMGLIAAEAGGLLRPTPLAAEHLSPGACFSVADYLGLAAESPGVVNMVECLRTNQPASAARHDGAAFIYRDGLESAMDHESSARALTLALAGRAKNVAPVLARRLDLSRSRVLLDVAGGTGIYAIALLQANPQLRAIVLDRPEVLKVTADFAEQYRVTDRLELLPGDMFTADLAESGADTILLSNVLHDWDVPRCRQIVVRCAQALPAGGRLLIHDVFLNDELDGPLPIALYSAALFTITEGRAYSAGEYRTWLSEAGLQPGGVTPTLIYAGVLEGSRR